MLNVDPCEWLKTNIESKSIHYFDHGEFTEHKIIGEGGFGIVKSAELNSHGKVALKSFKALKENVVKEFMKEVR